MQFSIPSIRRSRHPLVRALSVLLGVALIGVLLVFGLVVAGVLLIGGGVLLAVRQWKHGSRPAPQPSTSAPGAAPQKPAALEGEFVVIQQRQPTTH